MANSRRLGSRSNAIPFAPLAGQFVVPSVSNEANTTVNFQADNEHLVPFMPMRTFEVDDFGLSVTAAVAASTLRITMYAADARTGRPAGNLLHSVPIDSSTTGLKFITNPFEFLEGKMYWLGVKCSTGLVTIRAAGVGAAIPLGVTGVANPGLLVSLIRVQPINTPADWIFANSQLNAAPPPLVLLRVA